MTKPTHLVFDKDKFIGFYHRDDLIDMFEDGTYFVAIKLNFKGEHHWYKKDAGEVKGIYAEENVPENIRLLAQTMLMLYD